MRTRLSLLLWLSAQLLLALPAVGQAPTGPTAAPTPGLVVSSGYVESKRIASGEAFPIWITFENRTGQEVLGLRFVDFRTAGLQTRGACWVPVNRAAPKGPRFPSCIPDSAQPAAPSPLPQRLAPGEAVTVVGDLVRTGRSGEFMLTGMYQWTDAQGVQRRALLPVGPIEVTKNWEDWRTRVREDLPTVLKEVVLPLAKDLAWPLAAFLLGVLFKAGEQKRAALQQTWNQMLSTSHETAKNYYMPVSAAANWFLATLRPGAVQDQDESFYYLALLFRRMRYLVDDISGFYLKDRTGEELIVSCWAVILDSFVSSFPSGTGVEQKELLVATIEPEEALRQYKRKLSAAPVPGFPFPARAQLIQIREQFKSWTLRADFPKLDVPVLTLFYVAIDYEINRPYDPWYGEPQVYNIQEILKQEKKLKVWLREQKARPSLTDEEQTRVKDVETIVRLVREHRWSNTGRRAPWGTRWAVKAWYASRAGV